MAERELAAFVSAVTELFGPGQATISAQDWLDELALADDLPESAPQGWRQITVAAAVRLADKLCRPASSSAYG